MGDNGYDVVPADMTHDLGQWSAASEAMGRAAKKAENADTVAFGSFASHLETIYTGAAGSAKTYFTAGQTSLKGMSTNLANNGGQYAQDDTDSDGKVRGAGSGGGGNGGNGGGSGQGAGEHGGKDKDHYAQLMSTPNPMPTDPKDPDITFDRVVDPETGEVSWTPREMTPGEATATDGRDVEKIPQRADRIVVTMVDGEPRITYVDSGPDASLEVARDPGAKDVDTGPRWEGEPAKNLEGRVVAGSGAVEPQPQAQLQPEPPAPEWSRELPEGADYAVAEVRNGEVHLVFLDVQGNEVTMNADHRLGLAGAAGPEQVPVADQPISMA